MFAEQLALVNANQLWQTLEQTWPQSLLTCHIVAVVAELAYQSYRNARVEAIRFRRDGRLTAYPLAAARLNRACEPRAQPHPRPLPLLRDSTIPLLYQH